MKNKFIEKISPSILIIMLFLDILIFFMLGFMTNTYLLIKNNLIEHIEISEQKLPFVVTDSNMLIFILMFSLFMHLIIIYIFLKKIKLFV